MKKYKIILDTGKKRRGKKVPPSVLAGTADTLAETLAEIDNVCAKIHSGGYKGTVLPYLKIVFKKDNKIKRWSALTFIKRQDEK